VTHQEVPTMGNDENISDSQGYKSEAQKNEKEYIEGITKCQQT
jgi:hypothetical protein